MHFLEILCQVQCHRMQRHTSKSSFLWKIALGHWLLEWYCIVWHCTWSINIWNTILKDMFTVIIEDNMTVYSYSCAPPAFFNQSWPQKSPNLTIVNPTWKRHVETTFGGSLFLTEDPSGSAHSSHPAYIARAQHIHSPGWEQKPHWAALSCLLAAGRQPQPA